MVTRSYSLKQFGALTKSTHPDVRDKTPFEIVTGKKPDLSNLRIFGTTVKILKPESYQKSKVEPKVWDGIHVGYTSGDAYRCYIPTLGRVFVSRDVTFIEKLYRNPGLITVDIEEGSQNDVTTNDLDNTEVGKGSKKDVTSSEYDQDENIDEDESDDHYVEETFNATPTRFERNFRKPKRYGDLASLAFLIAESMTGQSTYEEPTTV